MPWRHSAWEFLSYNQYSAPGPPGCLEGRRLPEPGSYLTLQGTLASARGLLEMVCGTQIKTTTGFISAWSHRNILQSNVMIEQGTWLPEMTRELYSAGRQVYRCIHTRLGPCTNKKYNTDHIVGTT